MSGRVAPQLGALIVTPLVMIGVLAAVLMWAIKHGGSTVFGVVLFASAVGAAIVIARSVRRQIGQLSDHCDALLRTADEESRRADAANRVKDDFLAVLSHELRTPLNSLLGWAQLLAGGKLDPEMTKRSVQAIEDAGWAQARVIENLLDISQIVGGTLQIQPRETLVEPLVNAAIQSLRAAADNKQITIDAAIEPTLGRIVADPDRLQQIVWHLLSNAIKFTPAGGTVRIEASADGADLTIEVGDNGIGFDADEAPLLFESFHQGDGGTTRRFGGLGLGLGLVRHLVELHGGTVTAESGGPNRGATFRIRVPLRRAPASSLPAADEAAPTLRGVSVLVGDEDGATQLRGRAVSTGINP